MWNALFLIISKATVYDWLLLTFGVLLVVYIAGTWNYDYFTRKGFPSTKPMVPFCGDNIKFFLALEPFPDVARKMYKKGKGHAIYGIFEFGKPALLIRDPEMIKIITVKEFDHFMNHRHIVPAKADPVMAKNLFTLTDQRWRDMRTTLSPAFSTSKIKGMFPLVSQCAQQMAEHLHDKLRENADSCQDVEVDMKNLFARIANDVIASVAFGVQCDSLKQPVNEFYNMGKHLTVFSFSRILIFMGYFIIPKILEAFRASVMNPKAASFFTSLVHETIKERQKQNIFRPDMLQLLMQAREGKLKAEKEDQHESENIGNGKSELTDEDVSAQAIMFFFAGFETVSTALCFTAYELSHNPEVQQRLQQEVDAVWEKSGGKPTYEDIQGMKYLDAVINEALRKHPPAVIVERICNDDCTLPATATTPPITVRKGQSASIPIMGIHYDPEFWPQPERFDPERFSEERKHTIKPFTHLPFGAGPRLCIAQRFALVELKLTLTHLMRHFHLQPSPKTKHPLQYDRGFNMTIKGGFWNKVMLR